MIKKELDLEDIFSLSEIIEKMDIAIEVEKFFNLKGIENLEDMDEEEVARQMFMRVGVDLATKAAKRAHRARKEIKKLIAKLTEKTDKEVSKMNLKEIKEFFKELVKTEGFEDFLEQAEE